VLFFLTRVIAQATSMQFNTTEGSLIVQVQDKVVTHQVRSLCALCVRWHVVRATHHIACARMPQGSLYLFPGIDRVFRLLYLNSGGTFTYIPFESVSPSEASKKKRAQFFMRSQCVQPRRMATRTRRRCVITPTCSVTAAYRHVVLLSVWCASLCVDTYVVPQVTLTGIVLDAPPVGPGTVL
jgi:hypothetical protein